MSAFNASTLRGSEHRAARSSWPAFLRCLLPIAALAWFAGACSNLTDVDPTTDRIDVSPSTLTLEVGQSATLSAEAFDENGVNLTYGSTASGLPVRFEWTSRNAAYVEVDPSGQTVTVRGLQEYVDGGSTGWSTVEARVQGRSQPVGTARVQVRPVSNIQVSPSPIEIHVGETVNVLAEATNSTGAAVTVPTTWSVQDPTLASVSGAIDSNTTSITGLVVGETALIATMGTKVSNAVTVTVTEAPATYTATLFASVGTPVEIDFDTDGNLFVGNNDHSDPAFLTHIRRIDAMGDTSSFGPSVSDPDGVLVDRDGRFGDRNAVLTAGTYDAQFANNHITSIRSDGTALEIIIEAGPPYLVNPGSMAFLENGDLLIGNRDSVSVLRRNTGMLEADFYGHPLGSIVARNDTVYGIQAPQRIVALDRNGDVLAANVWPWNEAGDPDPLALAIDNSGQWFGRGLLAADSDGRILRMDIRTRQWSVIGGLSFTDHIFGLAVHPVDGDLYVSERGGAIWKVTRN